MATTKFAQHGLIRLAYEVVGEGSPTVLILHGLLQDRVTVRPLLEALQDRTKVVSVDVRGHASSSMVHGLDLQIEDLAQDGLNLLGTVGAQNDVILVGLEIGAVVAEGMRRLEPERIRDIVAINFPTADMLDTPTLKAIAMQAYKRQFEPALDRWLELSWGHGWQNRTPKARIAAAKRSVEAMHPFLTALTKFEVTTPTTSISLPGGTPFTNAEDLQKVLDVIEPMLIVS